jgi:photosystem II oxygen-evolving enhancer protein 2
MPLSHHPKNHAFSVAYGFESRGQSEEMAGSALGTIMTIQLIAKFTMFRPARLFGFLFAVILFCTSCTSAIAGLQPYTNGQYQFLYPRGWVEVEVQNASPGVKLVLRDTVERTENVSLIVSDVPAGQTLKELGTPTEVGYRFFKQAQDNPLKRQVEFINADSAENEGETYYRLEYAVTFPDGQNRHNLANVVIHNQKLYTFNLSTPERRWQQLSDRFQAVVNSFRVR